MTEQQAIERLTAKVMQTAPLNAMLPAWSKDVAKVAWNEMKAIAREDAKPLFQTQRYIGSETAPIDYDRT